LVLQSPTYVVLEVPAAVATRIHVLRERYDPSTARLPVEITVAGSSGVGPLSPDQDAEHVFRVIEEIGRRYLPFASAFSGIHQFPGTSIYWLAPRDRAPFEVLHSALVSAGLAFQSTPFSYVPHCTLSASPSVEPHNPDRLLNESFPKEEFTLAQLSLYQKVRERAALLRTFWFNES
jgi:2'-5' RNA ligase